MNEKIRIEIALWRYGIISPIIHASQKEQVEHLKQIADKPITSPNGVTRIYKYDTLHRWLMRYKRHGINGISPKPRSDSGKSRRIGMELAQIIRSLGRDYPFLNHRALFRLLISRGYIPEGSLSETTFRAFLKKTGIEKPIDETKARRSFEHPHILELWIADFMHGPHVTFADGKKKKLFLGAIIDDFSRFIVGAKWSLSESSEDFEHVLLDAILTHGIPKRLYCDNGSSFSNQFLVRICARLGISLIHSKPYDAPSRGKIERFFRTIRETFLPYSFFHTHTDLADFNRTFHSWLDAQYHRSHHRTIDGKPIDRFLSDIQNVHIRRLPKDEVLLAFYRELTRRVTKDCTVRIKQTLFEVPPQYAGHIITLRHPSDDPNDIWIVDNGISVHKLPKLDSHMNANNPACALRFRDQTTDVPTTKGGES